MALTRQRRSRRRSTAPEWHEGMLDGESGVWGAGESREEGAPQPHANASCAEAQSSGERVSAICQANQKIKKMAQHACWSSGWEQGRKKPEESEALSFLREALWSHGRAGLLSVVRLSGWL